MGRKCLNRKEVRLSGLERKKCLRYRKAESRQRLAQLFSDDVVIGDRVVISHGRDHEIFAEVVAKSVDNRFDIVSGGNADQPVYQLRELEGELLKRWYTKFEFSYLPSPEVIREKAAKIRQLNIEEKGKML